MKRFDLEDDVDGSHMAESPDGEFVALSEVLAVVEAEPEFPHPCPNLREFIAKAVETKDEDWILHMMRETVRKTKDSIAAKLNT